MNKRNNFKTHRFFVMFLDGFSLIFGIFGYSCMRARWGAIPYRLFHVRVPIFIWKLKSENSAKCFGVFFDQHWTKIWHTTYRWLSWIGYCWSKQELECFGNNFSIIANSFIYNHFKVHVFWKCHKKYGEISKLVLTLLSNFK